MNGLFDLTGKAAIVTGASRGLGMAFAIGLAEAGALVAVSDVLDVTESVREIEARKRRAIGIRADVSNEAEVSAMVERAVSEFGRIDILVNNAGIFRGSAAEDTKTEDWDLVMNVNLRAQLIASKAVSRHMIRQGSGKIINISSVAGILAPVESAAYNASKAGVILLTKTLAAEWGKHNIQVNAICPGLFTTEMTREFTEDSGYMEAFRSVVPLARPGAPEELAGTVLYLASKASDYMTGHALVVDGGWTAKLSG